MKDSARDPLSREIMRAIFDGDIQRFDALVAQGFDVHSVTAADKWNLLHRALVAIYIPLSPKMIEHLVRLGVDVKPADRYGNTPLHYAARLKDPALLDILLNAGAAVDATNNDGLTPLHLMLTSKPIRLDAVEALLRHGAKVEHRTPAGTSVLDYARTIAHGDDRQVVDLLERYRERKH
jgi:ankyrin repeat protein